jgi:membrane-associated protease RseP (regulator of RpoE activity)
LDNHEVNPRPDPKPAGEPPAAEPAPAAPELPAPTLKDWIAGNSIMLAILGAVVLLALVKIVKGDWDGTFLLNCVQVAVGIGFVIFIHELGHFLVAKWCDVQVDTFSIGFGPALPGCSFQWGETTYKLALLPLGGYVKMLGQVDGDESDDPESDDNPRSYRNKTVWQRMAIISAGVVLNVVLAFVCFIAAFTHGLKRPTAVVNRVDSGGRAWQKGINTGAVFTQIGDSRGYHAPTFLDLTRAALRSKAGEKITLVYRLPPDPKEYTVAIEPRVEAGDNRPLIGLGPSQCVVFVPQYAVWGDRSQPVVLNSPAAAAREAFDWKPDDVVVAATDPDDPTQITALLKVEPNDPDSRRRNLFELSQRWQRLAGQPLVMRVRRHGSGAGNRLAEGGEGLVEIRTAPATFAFGDTILAVTDPEDQSRVTALIPDEHNVGSGRGDFFDFSRRLQLLAGEFITVRVRRADGHEVDLIVPPAFRRTLGTRMTMGEVTAIRENSPAQAAGVDKGYILQQVVLTDADGNRKQFVTAHKKDETPEDLANFRDPLRLPYELRHWATKRNGVQATLTVFSGNPATREERGKPRDLPPVAWDGTDRWRFDKETPIGVSSPLAIPELGLAYRVETTVERGQSQADGGQLEDDDVITQIRFPRTGSKPGKVDEGDWDKLEHDQWAYVGSELQVSDFAEVSLRVERKKKGDAAKRAGELETKELRLTLQPDPTWPMADRGFLLDSDTFTVQAASFGQAVLMGLHDTREQILDVLYNIRNMAAGRTSTKNIGGPITILAVAYRVASVDVWEFIFFLGMISVNLAVLNFLPIPVLDGGHMVFLIYEKLRGRPATEQVRIAATYVGLLLIVSLMFFVFYLDIFTRGWFRGWF